MPAARAGPQTRCLTVLSSLSTPHGRLVLDMTRKTQQCLSVTHGERKLFAILGLGAGLRRQGAGMNNKAGEIYWKPHADFISLPSRIVIRNCSNCRNNPSIVQIQRLKLQRPRNTLDSRNWSADTNLHYHSIHTSSFCIIARQVCCLWAPEVQKHRLHNIENE